MGKLYLPARVPNEGARRLAAWLLSGPRPRDLRVLHMVGVDRCRIDRLLRGELTPEGREMAMLAEKLDLPGPTGYLVWHLPPLGRWGDPVVAIPMREAA